MILKHFNLKSVSVGCMQALQEKGPRFESNLSLQPLLKTERIFWKPCIEFGIILSFESLYYEIAICRL